MPGPYYADLGASRILEADTDPSIVDLSGSDDNPVANHTKTTEIIVACCIISSGKDTEASTYKLQWQDDASPGYIDLASDGGSPKCSYTLTDTSWAHGATVATGDQVCDIYGGDTRQAGERVKEQSLSDSIDLTDEYQSEVWFGVDLDNSDDGATYSFRLYSTAEGVAVGVCLATITIASAGVVEALSGTIDSQAGLSGIVKRERKIVGSFDGQSAVSAILKRSKALSGLFESQSDVSGILKRGRGLYGDIAGQADFSGFIKSVKGISGQISSQSGLDGAIYRIRGLIGLIEGQSAFTGALSVPGTVLLSGLIEATSDLSALLKVSKKLSGSIDAQSSLDAILGALCSLQGTIDGQSSLTADLKRLKTLIGSIDAQGSLTGALKRDRGLSALLEAQSAFTGALTVPGIVYVLLSGLIEGQADFSALLKRTRPLSGSFDATASFVGNLVRISTKAVAESIGVKEKVLRSSRTYSGGEDIITRILTSIWEDIDREETVWEERKTIQKNE